MGFFMGVYAMFSRSAARRAPAREIAQVSRQQNRRTPVYATRDKLCALTDWPRTGRYELSFATKAGLPIPGFPITHSAIALANPSDKRFSIYGRQSPFDVSMWPSKGITIRTRKDNEKDYLNRYFGFTLHPTGVYFNRDEIDQFLDSADDLINQSQSCNMVNSNCYSYSVTAMLSAIDCLLSRPVLDCAAISQILQVLKEHPLNDHRAFGVLNNTVVVDKLLKVLCEIKRQIALNNDNSDEAMSLLQETGNLIDQIKEESENYRLLSSGIA